MPRLAAVGTSLPPHTLTQDAAMFHYERVYAAHPELLPLLRVLRNAGVRERHFAFPLEYYLSGKGFEGRNDDFVAEGTRLAEEAARGCLKRAGIRPEQVDQLFLTTTTGLATPSLDALLANRLGLRRDVRRSPLFGLGCAGGAGALIRATEVLRGQPRQRALVVSVELSGQVFSLQATKPVDIVGVALFGDGAAAALVEGDEVAGAGPRVLAMESALFEKTEHVMGWDFTSDGMRLILSEDVPAIITGPLRGALARFLTASGLHAGQVAHWILHPGGRKILETYAQAFELGEASLEWSRNSLERVGNLSSAAVLFVLADLIASGRPRSGDKGILCALGPGFAAEMLLLGW